MAGTAGIPFGERKYLTINDTSAYMGLGVTKLKNIIKGGEFEDYITVGKQNKVMVDRIAFENFLKAKKHIEK